MRRQDGQPYPPNKIHQILSGLQRATCDSVFRDLHSKGVGTLVRHTATFTAEEEDSLWASGVLGCTSPKSLLNAVFFYVGKGFS